MSFDLKITDRDGREGEVAANITGDQRRHIIDYLRYCRSGEVAGTLAVQSGSGGNSTLSRFLVVYNVEGSRAGGGRIDVAAEFGNVKQAIEKAKEQIIEIWKGYEITSIGILSITEYAGGGSGCGFYGGAGCSGGAGGNGRSEV